MISLMLLLLRGKVVNNNQAPCNAGQFEGEMSVNIGQIMKN